MLFPQETHSESRLKKEYSFAQTHYQGTEVLSDTRTSLTKHYLKLQKWVEAAPLLLEEFNYRMEGRPTSSRVGDVVRRVIAMREKGGEVVREVVGRLEQRVRLEQGNGDIQGNLYLWLGRLYEEMQAFDKAEAAYKWVYEWKQGQEGKPLIDFYVKQELYVQGERYFYESYLQGNRCALIHLDRLYRDLISTLPIEIGELTNPSSRLLPHIHRISSLPLLHLTHQADFPLPTSHLSALSTKIRNLSIQIQSAKRLQHCAAKFSESISELSQFTLVFNLIPTEMLLNYFTKAYRFPLLYSPNMKKCVELFIIHSNLDVKQRYEAVLFLFQAASAGKNFELMERMAVRLSSLNKWSYKNARSSYF